MEGDVHNFDIPKVYKSNGLFKIECEEQSLLWALFIKSLKHDRPRNYMRKYPQFHKYQYMFRDFLVKHDLKGIKQDDFKAIEERLPQFKINIYKPDYSKFTIKRYLRNSLIIPKDLELIYGGEEPFESTTPYPRIMSPRLRNTHEKSIKQSFPVVKREVVNFIRLEENEWNLDENEDFINKLMSLRVNSDNSSDSSSDEDTITYSSRYIYVMIDNPKKLSVLIENLQLDD